MTKKTKKPNKATRILTVVEPKREKAGSQISRLASFITSEIPGEPSASEGAVDTAIRLLRDAYGPYGLTIPCDRTAEDAVLRLRQYLTQHVPRDILDRVGTEENPVDTAINLIMWFNEKTVGKDPADPHGLGGFTMGAAIAQGLLPS